MFIDKVRDVVGLYLDPPERAIVSCVDEKSHAQGASRPGQPKRQALDRSAPILPLMPGTPERRTHDYKRHGTTSLFAALDAASGQVIRKCFKRQRVKEFNSFLSKTEANVPNSLDVQLIMDNDPAHKTPAIRALLTRRTHWHVHVTPASTAGLNLVERLFAEITERQITRGAHRSVKELEAEILNYISRRNDSPKPFKRSCTADDILAPLQRYCERLMPQTSDANP